MKECGKYWGQGVLGNIISLFKRWKKHDDGTTAIEFGFIAMPFILMTLGIFEVSIMFAGGNLFEGAVADAARLIKTGQIQQNGGDESTFRQALCDSMPVLINCNDIVFEVVPVGSGSFFDATALGAQYNSDGVFQSRGFDAGTVNDVMLVRAVYEYPMITPLIGQLITGGEGSLLMMSTIVFQTEPYEFTGV
jgi:Flp pilus assembly protein TadG